MKVYLAKSNRCNPSDYMAIRSLLLSHKVELEEYIGGEYDVKAYKKLTDCDMLVVLPESTKMPITLGKGIYLQILGFLEVGNLKIYGEIQQNKKPAYIVSNVSSMTVLKIDPKRLKVINHTDYINHSTYTDKETVSKHLFDLLPSKYTEIIL